MTLFSKYDVIDVYIYYLKISVMKLFKTIFLLCITWIITNTAYTANVDSINVINSHEIDLSLSQDVTLSEDIAGDVKVLKDILVSFATRDISDYNKVILTLEEDLQMLTNYNLLTIFGANWNIDFKTEKSLYDVEIVNLYQPQDQWIVKIVTVDERTLEVYFKNPVDDSDFEFKIFSEIFVETISYINEQSLKLNLEKSIVSHSQYLLLILSLEDSKLRNISFDEELYDFETWNTLEILKEDAIKIDDTWKEVLDLENIALNAAQTPDTWAETWVLVALTLLVNAGLFMRKKRQK